MPKENTTRRTTPYLVFMFCSNRLKILLARSTCSGYDPTDRLIQRIDWDSMWGGSEYGKSQYAQVSECMDLG
jgi:hypothetical protein